MTETVKEKSYTYDDLWNNSSCIQCGRRCNIYGEHDDSVKCPICGRNICPYEIIKQCQYCGQGCCGFSSVAQRSDLHPRLTPQPDSTPLYSYVYVCAEHSI